MAESDQFHQTTRRLIGAQAGVVFMEKNRICGLCHEWKHAWLGARSQASIPTTLKQILLRNQKKDTKFHKAKLSHYRSGQDLGAPGDGDYSEFPENRHMEVEMLSAVRTGRLYSQDMSLVLVSVRGWVEPRAIVRPEGISNRKTWMPPLGIEPVNFQVVAHCPKQPRHILPHTKPKYSNTIII